MWQPSGRQWWIIWTAAIAIVLGWPPTSGRSLGVKMVNWAVDPADTLPTLPPPLAMGLDDNGDAVTEHDALEADYHHAREASALQRWRMDLKVASDPWSPTTERQILVGLGVMAALVVWRLEANRP
jgi:hypothetical protein